MSGLTNEGYDTDKGHSYLRWYETHFAEIRGRPLTLLELGVHNGGSLKMWRDYFPQAYVIGLDIKPPQILPEDRLRVFQGDATKAETFDMIERECGFGIYDIIIDDASHLGRLTKETFSILFLDRLCPGGLYILEDWGTAYLEGWPDGKALRRHADVLQSEPNLMKFQSHDYGMAGFAKQLMDHVSYPDVMAGGGSLDPLPIESMTIYNGLIFVRKMT